MKISVRSTRVLSLADNATVNHLLASYYDYTMTLGMIWIIPGTILLGAMLFGGIHLWIKRRREARDAALYGSRIRPDFYEDEK